MASRCGAFRPYSLRARTTLGIAALALVFLTAIGAGINFLVFNRVQAQIFDEAERVAVNWGGSLRPGGTPQPAPKGDIDLLQLVDSRGRVVAASPAAAGRPALSTVRPPADDRIQDFTECSGRDECVMLAAFRVFQPETSGTRPDEPLFVYAGVTQPPILTGYRLQLLTAAGVLLGVALTAWVNWRLAGKHLRPVGVIREHLSDITVSDLSLRVPQPSGCGEHALLVHTINQTLARLEEAVKLQRRFAATTSHELKTPLTGLRTQLEEAMLYPHDVDPRETIREALSATGRLEAIVDDLLVLARLRSGTPVAHEPIDLGALVAQEAAARTGGVPVHVHAGRDVHVRGNRIQLIRVLNNLLANARRHARTVIEVTAEHVDGQAVVTVTDDGDGIAPQDRERVFERFVRLDDGRRREPGGSGLGLAISRDIAHAHQGTLLIEDTPRGARFALRLPLHREAAVRADPPPDPGDTGDPRDSGAPRDAGRRLGHAERI
ncbi:sensor histidine kinase [Streptosporangium sp. NPDC002721]|uniref:sensor histidine kinase n=1 Tax=Streptosporangium sp. NPDC002721 TaxID=3366188 RepID=UPI00369D0D7C